MQQDKQPITWYFPVFGEKEGWRVAIDFMTHLMHSHNCLGRRLHYNGRTDILIQESRESRFFSAFEPACRSIIDMGMRLEEL